MSTKTPSPLPPRFRREHLVAASASAQVPCTGVNACKAERLQERTNAAGHECLQGQGLVNAGSSIECTVLKSK